MTNVSIVQSGAASVQAGIQQAERAASDIAQLNSNDDARADTATTSLAESAVDLLVAENQVKAGAAVVRTGDEILGTIIDTLA